MEKKSQEQLEIDKLIGKKLGNLLNTMKISQGKLGHIIGRNANSVVGYIKGNTTMKADQLSMIIKHYNLPEDYFSLVYNPEQPKNILNEPPYQPPEIKEPQMTLSTNEMLSKLILTNERLSIQQGELIRLLAKDSDTLNRNSISIEQLSSKLECLELTATKKRVADPKNV